MMTAGKARALTEEYLARADDNPEDFGHKATKDLHQAQVYATLAVALETRELVNVTRAAAGR